MSGNNGKKTNSFAAGGQGNANNNGAILIQSRNGNIIGNISATSQSIEKQLSRSRNKQK